MSRSQKADPIRLESHGRPKLARSGLVLRRFFLTYVFPEMVPTNKLGPQLYMYTASFLAGVRNGATPGVWTPAEILEANPTEGTAERSPNTLPSNGPLWPLPALEWKPGRHHHQLDRTTGDCTQRLPSGIDESQRKPTT